MLLGTFTWLGDVEAKFGTVVSIDHGLPARNSTRTLVAVAQPATLWSPRLSLPSEIREALREAFPERLDRIAFGLCNAGSVWTLVELNELRASFFVHQDAAGAAMRAMALTDAKRALSPELFARAESQVSTDTGRARVLIQLIHSMVQ